MKRLIGFALACSVTTASWVYAQEKTEEKEKKQEPEKKITSITNSIGMTLNLIPTGSFTMGSGGGEIGRYAAEKQHPVAITKPFHIGIFEVTQQEFAVVMGSNPSAFTSEGDSKELLEGLETNRFPVEMVSWEEAVEFCTTLSALEKEKKAGRTYRLPTESEWEYACRAGTSGAFSFGDELSSKQANFDGNHPYLHPDEVRKGTDPAVLKGPYLKRPTIVGTYLPNAFGLYDMHGNVWVWCADWYSPVYFRNSPLENPQGPETGTHRVARGGGWYYFAAGCRSASRYERLPTARRNTDGFRIVCELIEGVAAAE